MKNNRIKKVSLYGLLLLSVFIFYSRVEILCEVYSNQIPYVDSICISNSNIPIRASPEDTCMSSIYSIGINNRIVITNSTTKPTSNCNDMKDSIYVCGEGNVVSVNRNNSQSTLKISQKGNNNNLKITLNNR